MSKCTVNIWQRDFDLDVIYHNFPGEVITDRQVKIAGMIVEADFESAYVQVVEYIKQNNPELSEEIVNIFKYAVPHSILVAKDVEMYDFALFLHYKFDMEHGLSILFSEGTCVKVCMPDDIL